MGKTPNHDLGNINALNIRLRKVLAGAGKGIKSHAICRAIDPHIIISIAINTISKYLKDKMKDNSCKQNIIAGVRVNYIYYRCL